MERATPNTGRGGNVKRVRRERPQAQYHQHRVGGGEGDGVASRHLGDGIPSDEAITLVDRRRVPSEEDGSGGNGHRQETHRRPSGN